MLLCCHQIIHAGCLCRWVECGGTTCPNCRNDLLNFRVQAQNNGTTPVNTPSNLPSLTSPLTLFSFRENRLLNNNNLSSVSASSSSVWRGLLFMNANAHTIMSENHHLSQGGHYVGVSYRGRSRRMVPLLQTPPVSRSDANNGRARLGRSDALLLLTATLFIVVVVALIFAGKVCLQLSDIVGTIMACLCRFIFVNMNDI
jgi:hypothetical protein